MDKLKNVSAYLKAERTKNNISARDIAENIGRSTPSIFYLERNAKSNIAFMYLIFLRKQGIDINHFFDEL